MSDLAEQEEIRSNPLLLRNLVNYIRDLEAGVRRLQNNEVNDCDLLGMHERRIADLEAERDAIRAKTIEECAIQVAIFLQSRIGEQAAAAIRALAQTDESKTEPGE